MSQRYYTTVELGRKQRLTPEGFLVCEDVPIARTGVMLYAPGEVPVTPDPRDKLIRIERSADEVFSPATIASFEGKAVTVDHPSEDVTPDNWSELAHGVVQNVRRGSGIDDEFLIADFVLTQKRAIDLVRSNKLREVSCGYDASYEEIAPGRGRQTNIVGNHVALVENGRCGSRCAIGDSMKKLKFIDKLRAAFKNRDEAEHEKALEEATKDASEEETEEEKKKKAEEKETKDALSKALDAINGLTKRVTDLEAKKDDEDEEEEATEDGKKKKKAKDSAELRDEHIDVLARAEILAPGIHVPTFDAASDPQKTRDAMCGLRLKALQAAQEGKFKDTVEMLVGKGRDLKSLTCDAVASAFVATSEIVRRENNAQQTRTSTGDNKQPNIASSIADMNQRNAAFWANRK